MVKDRIKIALQILRGKQQLISVDNSNPYAQYIPAILQTIFDGSPFEGSFGPTKYYQYIDYWTLRERSIQLFTENPYAKGLIKRLIRNEINNGLSLEATPVASIIGIDEDEAQAWADSREIDWRLWSDIDYICDYNEQKTLGELAADCRMTSLISGDCLVVIRINPKTKLPHIQLIDGRHVQSPLLFATNGNKIKHGVELDSKGRHVAYHIKTDNIGESVRIPAWGEKSGRRLAWLVYGADTRLDDVRGEPLIACMLYMLKELDRYRDSEQRAAVVNSLLPMFIKKGESGISSRVVDGGATRRGTEEIPQTDGTTKKWNWGSMLPGTVPQTLAKGEEPVSFNTQRPNVNYKTFETAILDVLAWVCEVPPEIMRLYFQGSYSASRQANNEFNTYLNYRNWKFGKDFYQLIYIEHTVQAVLLGHIQAPGLIDAWWYERNWRLFGAWTNAEWTGISRPSVDIEKDVNAGVDMLKYGLTTQDQQCRKLSGMSFKTVLAKRKREIEAAKTMGVSFGTEETTTGEPITQPIDRRLDRIENNMLEFQEYMDRVIQ